MSAAGAAVSAAASDDDGAELLQSLPFEPASLLRLVRGFAAGAAAQQQQEGGAPAMQQQQQQQQQQQPDVETAGMALWELSADAQAAAALVQLQLLPAVVSQLRASLQAAAGGGAHHHQLQQHHHQQQQAAHHHQQQPAPGRVLELCCGILANLHCCPQLARQLAAAAADAGGLGSLLLQLVEQGVDDPPALAELCRLLAAALATPEGADAWLPLLLAPQQLAWLVQGVVANTLHTLLLERSLQLVAALLAAAADAAEAAEAAADDSASNAAVSSSGVGDGRAAAAAGLMLQLGLADVLCAFLQAAVGPQQQLDASKGGWSDDDEEDLEDDEARVAPGSAASSRMRHLCRQTPVLLALLSVLQQLGQHDTDGDAGAAAATNSEPPAQQHQQQLPAELPALLLQLLAACSERGQHEVQEALLPVLVVFRRGVLAALLCDGGDDGSGDGGSARGASGSQQRVAHLACIVAALQDCEAAALDAIDAGWYLLAAGTRCHGSSSSGGAHQPPLITANTRTDDLRRLCRCVAASRVVESAAAYAEACRASLAAALAAALGDGDGAEGDAQRYAVLQECLLLLGGEQQG